MRIDGTNQVYEIYPSLSVPNNIHHEEAAIKQEQDATTSTNTQDQPATTTSSIPAKRSTYAEWRPFLPQLNGENLPYPAKGNEEFINWYVKEHFLPKLPELLKASPTLRSLLERAMEQPNGENIILLAFENSYSSYMSPRTEFADGKFTKKSYLTIGKFNLLDLDDRTNLAKLAETFAHELFHSLQPPRRSAIDIWKEGGNAETYATDREGIRRELETMAAGFKVVNELRDSWGSDIVKADRFGVFTDNTGTNHNVLNIFREYEKGNKQLAEEYCRKSTPGFEVLNGGKLTYYERDFIGFASSIAGHLSSNNGSMDDYKRLYPDIKKAVDILTQTGKKSNDAVLIRTISHARNVAIKLADHDYAIRMGNILFNLYERKIRDSEDQLKTKDWQLDVLTTLGDSYFAKKDYITAGKKYSAALSRIEAPNSSGLHTLRRITSKIYELRDLNQVNVLEPSGEIKLASRLTSTVDKLIGFAQKNSGDPIYNQILVELYSMNGYLCRDYYNNLLKAQVYFQEALKLDPHDIDLRNIVNGNRRKIETPPVFRLNELITKATLIDSNDNKAGVSPKNT